MGGLAMTTARMPPRAGQTPAHLGRTPAMGARRGPSRGGGRGGLRAPGPRGAPKARGRGRGRGRGAPPAMTTGRVSPTMTGIKTTAAPPPELTGYAERYGEEVLGGHAARLKELREKGGAFMEEFGRQGRESVTARIEEARQRAAEQGVPFDEQAAMREALQSEAGGRAEGLMGAEERIDRALGAQTQAFQGGLGIVQSPSQAAMAQKAQSLAEQQALMGYWLGQETAATQRSSAAAQQQAQWMSMLSSMLGSMYA